MGTSNKNNMETAVHVKANKSWERVEIPLDLQDSEAFHGLIDCQVLTDYEIFGNESESSKKKKKKTKIKKPSDIQPNKNKSKQQTKWNIEAIDSSATGVIINGNDVDDVNATVTVTK